MAVAVDHVAKLAPISLKRMPKANRIMGSAQIHELIDTTVQFPFETGFKEVMKMYLPQVQSNPLNYGLLYECLYVLDYNMVRHIEANRMSRGLFGFFTTKKQSTPRNVAITTRSTGRPSDAVDVEFRLPFTYKPVAVGPNGFSAAQLKCVLPRNAKRAFAAKQKTIDTDSKRSGKTDANANHIDMYQEVPWHLPPLLSDEDAKRFALPKTKQFRSSYFTCLTGVTVKDIRAAFTDRRLLAAPPISLFTRYNKPVKPYLPWLQSSLNHNNGQLGSQLWHTIVTPRLHLVSVRCRDAARAIKEVVSFVCKAIVIWLLLVVMFAWIFQ